MQMFLDNKTPAAACWVLHLPRYYYPFRKFKDYLLSVITVQLEYISFMFHVMESIKRFSIHKVTSCSPEV